MTRTEYGICRLATVAIRRAPSDAAEMISQLLFGEHYSVVETSDDQKWLKIENDFDGYQGWIDKKQHHMISREFYTQINNSDYQISTDIISELRFNGQLHHVSVGSVLPLLSNPLFSTEEQVAFEGQTKPIYTKLDREEMLRLAHKMINTPYYWGGRSSFGIDCSGFTQLIYRLAGFHLPRDSSQQILKGDQISLAQAQIGDLAFFNNHEGKMNHVGIVSAPDRVLHASGKVRVDQLDTNGIFNLEQKLYTHHLFMVKRYLR